MIYLLNFFTTLRRRGRQPVWLRSSRFMNWAFGGALWLLTFPAALAQTTYYVAASGNDGNDGRSDGSPFQSLSKVNSLNLQAGDQVLFRRGDTFRGTLTVRQSGNAGQPIVFDAYGSGNKPVLAASTPVTGWSNIGNGVWQANCSACGNRMTGLFRNGNDLPLGRYPNAGDNNKGYLTVQSHAGYGQITAQEYIPLNLNTDWNGGEVVIRTTQWVTDRYGLNHQNGNTLIVSNPNSGYYIQDNFGFFIQNHPATLDQPGEWAFDTHDKTIRLYDPYNNPNDQTMTVAVQERGVDLSNVSNVTLRNLRLTESLSTGLFAYNGNNLTVSSVDVTDAGEDGVTIAGGGSNVLIENSTILYAHNNGLTLDPYANFTFRGNTLRHAGVDAGRGRSGDGQGNGLRITGGQNTLIENNIIDSIGYNGITYNTSLTIQRNVISNFCMTKSDGAGIYTWNGNQANMGDIHILNNIVFNAIGAVEGVPASAFKEYSGANGIFFDDCARNAEIRGNTVFNCYGLGFFLHEVSNLILTDNTSFNNREGQLSFINYVNKCPSRDNVSQNNILFSRLPNQFVVKFESSANDLSQFGSFDNNYYLRPFEDVFKVRVAYNAGSGQTGADISLSQWQSQFGKDYNSKNSPLTYSTTVLTPTGNVLLNNTFDGDANGWGVAYSNQGNGRVDYDNSNRLDGGSLRVSFPQASNQSYSYVLTSNNIGPVSNGRSYKLDFDAVATGNKRVEVILRQKFGNYSDVAPRSTILLTGNRQHYTVAFTVTTDEALPILALQVYEDGQTAWFDNVHLEEANATVNNPDDKIKFYYNPTGQNQSYGLDGNYRDAKGQSYSGSVTLTPFTSVVLLRDGGTSQPPTTTLRTPENPSGASNGLTYNYYEGSWNNLPDFGALTPTRTGTASTVDISPRSRDSNYGLRFTGYVSVPTDGVYTFYTTSDDGSKIYVGNTEVVSNDALQVPTEKSGTIGLKAGVHAITVIYFQNGGGQALSVSYSGPNLGKQTIPNGAYYYVPTTQPPTTNLRDPENPGGATAGLDYQYYEYTGDRSQIPDFSQLGTPTKTGTVGTVDLSMRNRDGQYAVRYMGFVSVPTDGQYTFYTTSDDGSKLYIGSTEVVSNDAIQPPTERSGTIGLKAGVHAMTVTYFQNGGGQALSVSYSGPGIGKQTIPASALLRVGSPGSGRSAGTGTGLRAEYFNNKTLTSPSALTRTDPTVDFDWGQGSPANGTIGVDNFSVRWSGQVEAPVSGNYTFSTISDDGVRLWVNGNQIINNWNDHAPTTDNSASLNLTAGQRYDIRMEYYENGGGAVARLQWSYPGQGQQAIPQNRLYPASGSGRVAVSSDSAADAVTVYPNPAREEVRVRYYAPVAGDVRVQLLSLTGAAATQIVQPVEAGETVLTLPVREIPRGAYLLTLTTNRQRITRKVILTE